MSTRHFKVNTSKMEFLPQPLSKKQTNKKHPPPKQLQPPLNRRPSASLAAFPILGNSSSVFLISQAQTWKSFPTVLYLLTSHPVYQQILMTLFFFFVIKIFIYLFDSVGSQLGHAGSFFPKLQHAGIFVAAWRILIRSV